MRIVQSVPSVVEMDAPCVTWVVCDEHKTWYPLKVPSELDFVSNTAYLYIALEKLGRETLDSKCAACVIAKLAKDEEQKLKGKMSRRQFLLLKLAEECMEVAQRCSKQMQFGRDQTQVGDGFHHDKITPEMELTNAQRLVGELIDLHAVEDMLADEGEIDCPDEKEMQELLDAKQRKIEKYFKYSQELGMIA